MTAPLLCELHAHSTWSDGSLSVPELVDLYGGACFDVLAVTDHVVRTGDPWRAAKSDHALAAEDYRAYLAQLEAEAERAARLPFVANGDFHRPEHLATWKTLVPCPRREDALVDYLRSPAPDSLTRFERAAETLEEAA